MDREELEKWLQDKPREVSVAIAARAGLRVAVNLPLSFKGDNRLEDLTFTSLRCVLISSLSAKMPSDDIMRAADSVADSATLSADSAAYSADSAALSAFSADSADSAADSAAYSAARSANSAAFSADFEIWPEVEWDMGFVESTDIYDGATKHDGSINHGDRAVSLIEQKLFNTPNNNWSPKDFQNLETLKSSHPEYSWWVNWLIAMHDGSFQDWDLAYDIATKIPEDIWVQGAIPVSHWIQSLGMKIAEKIDFDEGHGVFIKTPLSFEKPKLLSTILQRVEDATEDAKTGNFLSEHDYEIRVILRALGKYRDDPQRLEMDFASMAKSIARRIQTGDLPDSPEVFELSQTLAQAALDIRAIEPEIAEDRKTRADQKRAEYTEQERKEINALLPFYIEITDEAFGAEFQDDFSDLVGGEIPALQDENGQFVLPPIRLDASDRIVSRTIKMNRHAEENESVRARWSEACDKIKATPEYKTLEIVTRVGAGVGLVTVVIGLLL